MKTMQACCALIFLWLSGSAARAASESLDLLITGGTVYDGTGAPPQHADVGVLQGRIAYVGPPLQRRAAHVLDATGLAVAPGFIDPHNHALPEAVEKEPGPYLDEPFLLQGVTTVLVGPDGHLAPDRLQALVSQLSSRGSGTNYACYVGHNGIRRQIMGSQQRAPTISELDAMRGLVREGMRMGCVGLSTGLMYEPGMWSRTAEVIELAREVTPFGGTYDSHTRDPVRQMIASESEAIEIGSAAGIPAKLGHLKAVGLGNRHRISEVLQLVEAARNRGVEVVADQYPYDGAATGRMKDILLIPGNDDGTAASFTGSSGTLQEVQRTLRAALENPARIAAIKAATENGINGGFAWVKAVGYDSLRIVASHEAPQLVGQNIATLAKSRQQNPFDLIVSLIMSASEDVAMTFGSIDESDVQELLVQPWVMISSDGSYVPRGPRSGVGHHPRSTGSFPRVLGHYSRDLKLLTLQEAIRKMTSLPADHLRLYDRGRIASGYAADISMFDPRKVRDRSTYSNPDELSEGIVHVLVNGQLAVRDGRATGKAAGRFVPRQAPKPAG